MLGGKHLYIPVAIAYNGLSVSNENTLFDTGAAVYALMDTKFAKKFRKKTGAPRVALDKTCRVTDYSGKGRRAITHATRAHLTVDGRRQQSVYFLEVPMTQNIIIGRIWLEDRDVDISARHRCLKWPESIPPGYPSGDIDVTAALDRKPKIDPVAQKDMERRDSAFAKDEKRRMDGRQIKILKRGEEVPPLARYNSTYQQDKKEALDKMQRNLEGRSYTPITIETRKNQNEGPVVEINFLGKHEWTPEMGNDTLTLNEIDQVLCEKELEEEPEYGQEIGDKLPPEYKEFWDVFSKKKADELPPHRACDHRVELTEPLPAKKNPLYHMSLEHVRLLREYLKEHLDKGFISPSKAAYASPVLFAKKPGGGWRFCVDYRKINEISKKDAYPHPLINETFRQLYKAKIFTRLDVRHAFNRIRMHPDSKELTAFTTRFGQYEYDVLPFGLTGGPATFQRYINETLFDYLDVFCTAYADDILIYSENEKDHKEHVKKVLARLRGAGLQIDIRKSEFSVTETRFLGFIVTTKGIRMDPAKIRAIVDWETPRNIKGVRSFLGFVTFYRRFIKAFGRIARPLQRLLRKGVRFVFGPEQQEAFEKIKQLVVSNPVLVKWHPEYPTKMETDASDGVTAGVLTQKQPNGEQHPVAFYSKTMNENEINYGIEDKEMLAVIKALKEWRAELLGLQDPDGCEVITDHQALEAFSKKRQLNGRQARWSEILSEFNLRWKWRPGKENVLADALSRKQEDLSTAKAKKEASRKQTMIDPAHILSVMIEVMETETPGGFELVDAVLIANRACQGPDIDIWRSLAEKEEDGWSLQKGLLLKKGCLFIPDQNNLRTKVLAEIHDKPVTGHCGRNKTRKLVRRQYYWPRQVADIDRYIANCRVCRRTTVPRDKTPGLLKPLPIPDRPWQHVSIDFKSFPKDKKGFDAIMVVVDRLGKRTISIPCQKEINAQGMAELYYDRIWRIYGTPESVVSDRGPQFISVFTQELCRLTGVKQKISTSGHPQTDGNTEIVNQWLDQRLRAFVSHYQDDWSRWLPAMDFAQAVLPHESTGMSPFELEFGYPPRMHFDWEERTKEPSQTPRETLSRTTAQEFAKRAHEAWEQAKENLKKAQKRQQTQANKTRREPDFDEGDYVYVSKKGWTTDRPSVKLDTQNAGPYKILEKVGHSYRLELPQNLKVHDVLHADRLRKAPMTPMPGQEEEPEPPMEVEGEQEWEVVKLLASRIHKGKLQYRAEWKGYDEDPVYYDAESFKNSPHKVRQFHEDQPEAPGPPVNLETWLRAYEDDEPIPGQDENDNLATKGGKSKTRRHARLKA